MDLQAESKETRTAPLKIVNFAWRCKARFIAYVDLILTVVSFVAVVVFAVLIATNRVHIDHKAEDGFLPWITWMFIGIALIANILAIWINVLLLKATVLGADIAYSLNKAKIWRSFNIYYLVILTLSLGIAESWIALGLHLIWRLVFIFVVHKFVQEVDDYCTAPPVARLQQA